MPPIAVAVTVATVGVWFAGFTIVYVTELPTLSVGGLTVTMIVNATADGETLSHESTTRGNVPRGAAALAVTVAPTTLLVAADSVAELSKLTLIPVGRLVAHKTGL
jgi:hypothetical protein